MKNKKDEEETEERKKDKERSQRKTQETRGNIIKRKRLRRKTMVTSNRLNHHESSNESRNFEPLESAGQSVFSRLLAAGKTRQTDGVTRFVLLYTCLWSEHLCETKERE